MIVVVDYGMGNSGSILNILYRIGAEATLSADPSVIARATKLVLPGVGAFDAGMERLHQLGLVSVLEEKVRVRQTPILGICLGMQLFGEWSEEGAARGLGWIEGGSVRFEPRPDLRVPHMGWNRVRVCKPSPLLADLEPSARFYFVHSYHLQCRHEEDVLARSFYGSEFVAAVSRGSVTGVQFHPEKSLRWGLRLFRSFVHGLPPTAATGDPVSAAA